MSDGKHCPQCNEDIGLWPIVSAGLPTRIRCPWCRASLAYRKVLGVNATLAMVLVVILTGSYGLFAGRPSAGPTWALIALVAWVPVEILVAWFLRNRRQLFLVQPRR